MATTRKDVLANGEIYHVFNRGVERRIIFSDKREYQRAIDSINYYRFAEVPLKLSKYFLRPLPERLSLLEQLQDKSKKRVSVFSYCLMPNHYHFLIRQEVDNGISQFISDFSNSLSKYFNTRHSRSGPLLQGPFKATRVETLEQFLHLSRYIHLNPVASRLIKPTALFIYPWSSLPEYCGATQLNICDKEMVLSEFKSVDAYKKFVSDQVEYALELEKIKHLTIDTEEWA